MAETIAVIRDIVIIVWGVMGIIAFLAVTLVALGIYRAAKPILTNLGGTVGEARVATRLVTDAVIRARRPDNQLLHRRPPGLQGSAPLWTPRTRLISPISQNCSIIVSRSPVYGHRHPGWGAAR